MQYLSKIVNTLKMARTRNGSKKQSRSQDAVFSPNSRTGGPILCATARVDVLDTRKSGLGARGGAFGVPIGGVDVRLFGGRVGGGRDSFGPGARRYLGRGNLAIL